jgi:outer membrane protein assembly factor BamB
MLFETHLAYGAKTPAEKAIERFDTAGTYAQNDDHQVRLHLAYTEAFEKMAQHDRAVDHLRLMFLNWPDHNHVFPTDEVSGEIPVGQYAKRRIHDLIAEHGQAIYAKYDAEAGKLFDQATAAKEADALRRLTVQYPNSKFKPLAWLNAGRFELAAGRLGDANAGFRHAESTALEVGQKAEALAGQFAVAEARGEKPQYARRARRVLGEMAELLAGKPSVEVPIDGRPRNALAWAQTLLAGKYKDVPQGTTAREDPSRLASLSSAVLQGNPVWASSGSDHESLLRPIYFGNDDALDVVLTRDVKGGISAFDVETGKRLWKAGSPTADSAVAAARCIAAVYGNLLVICDLDVVAAFRLDQDGKLAWKHPVLHHMGEDFSRTVRSAVGSVPFNTQTQYAFTPDAVVIATVEGEIKVLDAHNGKLRFAVKEKQYTFSAPAGNEDAVAYLSAGGRQLVILDALNGEQICRIDTNDADKAHRVYYLDMDDQSLYVEVGGALNCYDPHKGKLRWSRALGQAADPASAAAWILDKTPKTLLVGTRDAKILLLDAASGETLWQHQFFDALPLRGALTGGQAVVAVAKASVYGPIGVSRLVQNAEICVCDARTGKLRWKQSMMGDQTGDVILSDPVVTAGQVLTAVRGRRHINARVLMTDCVRLLDLATGKLLDSRTDTAGMDALRPQAYQSSHVPPTAVARKNTLILDRDNRVVAHRENPD